MKGTSQGHSRGMYLQYYTLTKKKRNIRYDTNTLPILKYQSRIGLNVTGGQGAKSLTRLFFKIFFFFGLCVGGWGVVWFASEMC